MLYEIAHIIKEKFSFLWNMIEWGNAMVFSVMKRNQLKEVPSVLNGCSDVYEIRIADEADVEGLFYFSRKLCIFGISKGFQRNQDSQNAGEW